MKDETKHAPRAGTGDTTVTDYIGPFTDPDRYELSELTSRGAEGELWRAFVVIDGQALPVAVKILHPTSDGAFAAISERWHRQAELLQSLEHPSLVKVREVFEGPSPHVAGAADPATHGLFLVMNWAPGESLPSWCATHPDRDVLDVTRIVTRLSAAIDYLHSGNATGGVPVLHRDIKPANVIVDGPEIRLVDFGFARLAGDEMTIIGTPSYIAPEVVAGAQQSESSDRYSLGATAYYLFTGEDPAPSDISQMTRRLLSVRGFEGRDDIVDHLMAMMSRDPARRPANVIEWAQALAVGVVSDRLPVSLDGGDGAASPRGAVSENSVPARRSRRGLIIGIATAVIVLAGAGAAVAMMSGGGGPGGSTAAAGEAPTATRVVMPDVTGLRLTAARSRLRRAGISEFTVRRQESSEAVDTVLSTDPTGGARVRGTVTVTVAKKATTVPDVTGKSLSEATDVLEGLGLTVNSTDVLDDTKVDGTILSQEPAAGSPLPEQVALRVARRSVSTFLADLQPVAGTNESSEPANLSGTAYAHPVQLSAGDSQNSVEYDLGRHYRRLLATMGLRDDSGSGDQVKIEVFGDGRPLFSQITSIGQAVPLDVDVTGVLRLRLSATLVASTSDCCSDTTAVWGDIRALGSAADVPGYSTPSSVPTTLPTSVP